MSSGKVLLGVMVGAASGALLGILFAPHKGKVVRRKMSRKGEKYVEEVKEKFNDLLEDLSEKFDQVKDEVSDFAEQKMSKSGAIEKEVKSAKD
ncbi:MAG TPA: YtxH domain-containing protein [Prolixibacteraceae bacterium]|nr:YtxH domain-containing protein [Prolixibacteraceae bacterium]